MQASAGNAFQQGVVEMCSNKRPDFSEFLDNLKKPMPLTRKAGLYLRNNLLKIRKLQSCCGNHGQPGC
jgi:hypothetical protein